MLDIPYHFRQVLPQLRIEDVFSVLENNWEVKKETFHGVDTEGVVELETDIVSKRERSVSIKQAALYVKKEAMDVKSNDFKGRNGETSSLGVTNSTLLYKSSDFEKDLYTFKQNMHCSQEVVVFFLNKEMFEQRHDCVTVTEINKKFLMDLFEHSHLITLQKKSVKKNVLDYFKTKNVVTKRCLVRCLSVIHGLALSDKWRSIIEEPESKKANNTFSNYQRPDRVAGKNLALEYQAQYGLSRFSGYSEIEAKANVSFDIFNKEGFLTYTSEKITVNHTVFYESGKDIYFVKEKYLNAFGKIVNPKKRSPKKLKRL